MAINIAKYLAHRYTVIVAIGLTFQSMIVPKLFSYTIMFG